MGRSWIRALVPGALMLALAGAVDAQSNGQSFAWWKSEQFQKEVGLTAEQCTRIDNVFQTALPRLRQGKEELDRQETELSRLIETNADEALVTKQVDRVEAIRASLNKTRTLLLLHERQVLTPDQLVRFKAAHDKWVQDHPRPPRSGDHDAAHKQ
jgi:Spy/CpxP family protein refolding chaperone